MEWTKTPPRAPGWYWYRHRDGRKLEKDANAAEPVKVTSEGKVLFVDDWRAHSVADLEQGLWGGRVEVPPLPEVDNLQDRTPAESLEGYGKPAGTGRPRAGLQ